MKILDFKSKDYYNYENKKSQNKSILILVIIGLIIGFINGFWGGGGGMICVPFLSSIIHLDEKVSHATTILIMLPLSICSFIIYLINGSIQYLDALNITLGFVLGGLIGAFLLNKINNYVLQIIFSIILIFGGIKLLF